MNQDTKYLKVICRIDLPPISNGKLLSKLVKRLFEDITRRTGYNISLTMQSVERTKKGVTFGELMVTEIKKDESKAT